MRTLKLFAVIFSAAALITATFTSCDGTDTPEPVFYTVTVTTDSADGGTVGAGIGAATTFTATVQAVEGETVTISATPADGYIFNGWTVTGGGVTLSSDATATATFTMPAGDVNIEAAFAEGEAQLYTVTVTADPADGGTAGAGIGAEPTFTATVQAAEGETVTISATPADGYLFNGWAVTSGGITLSPDAAATTATFIMPAGNVSVKAVFVAEGVEITVIDFEEATLFDVTGAAGYSNIYWGIELAEEDDVMGQLFDGILYSESGANFGGYYTDFGGMWETWGGFAVSSNNERETQGTQNQFSAYASTVTKFAIAYDLGGYFGGDYERPVITFDAPVTPVSAMFANTTWVYLYCGDNPEGYYTVVATGYLGETETGTVNIELVKDGNVVSDWTNIDLSALGTVDAIKFKATSDDSMLPTYFCMDDLQLTSDN